METGRDGSIAVGGTGGVPPPPSRRLTSCGFPNFERGLPVGTVGSPSEPQSLFTLRQRSVTEGVMYVVITGFDFPGVGSNGSQPYPWNGTSTHAWYCFAETLQVWSPAGVMAWSVDRMPELAPIGSRGINPTAVATGQGNEIAIGGTYTVGLGMPLIARFSVQ